MEIPHAHALWRFHMHMLMPYDGATCTQKAPGARDMWTRHRHAPIFHAPIRHAPIFRAPIRHVPTLHSPVQALCI
eukprot:47665-Chlamydomonas_euryale.AAC.1